MEYQRFIPEGWTEEIKPLSIDFISEAMREGKIIEGVVKSCDANYNLYVNLGDNITGMIPREEVEAISVDESGFPKPNICTSKVNKVVQFRVKDIGKNDIVILSRKSVGRDAITWIKDELKEGMIVDGIVRNIRPYGAFIEIGGGIVGLVHVEDISVARIKTPYERFFVGQKIKVMIKSIDRQTNRVILSYKEILGTWEENAEGLREGTVISGIVRETEKNKRGIFVEIKPNLVGMAEYKENLEYGQTVDIYIKKIIPERKKIKLIIND